MAEHDAVARFLEQLGIRVPLVQAPMAGVSTPALAAAVSNAGALGSIAVGAADVAGARAMIREVRASTDRAFNLNLFCHRPPPRAPEREAAWLASAGPDVSIVRRRATGAPDRGLPNVRR